VINIIGSFFLGWFMTFLTDRYMESNATPIHPEDLRLLIAVGFTGAFTTFSTFEYESDSLFREGHGLTAILYIAMSVVVGLYALRAGSSLARLG
jgi:CrcB protein